jgi:hypothetical protein
MSAHMQFVQFPAPPGVRGRPQMTRLARSDVARSEGLEPPTF